MKSNHQVGSVFLEKYTSQRKLGKGAFGDVYLVSNGEGQQMALKLIDKKKLSGENEDMIVYLKGQIKCMKDMIGEHMTQLYHVDEDQHFYYMLLEYCDGGDLIHLQTKQKNRVFSLSQATQLLSQVINGLQQLHKKGYLHRDIKPQNILLKYQNGKQVLKLADFGFAKKANNHRGHGTVLGTEVYMSPQIYRCGIEGIEGIDEEEEYGFEVDMWAFGVLFFYMLNMDFPFKTNPYWSVEEKFKELTKQGTNFSYRKAVMKTRRKLEENNSDELEDLFRKIFCLEDRITFSEIRQHPIFRKHFPKVSQASEILYRAKYVSTRRQKSKGPMIKKPVDSGSGVSSQGESQFEIEKKIIERENQELEFLWQVIKDLPALTQGIDRSIVAMAAFNLAKYHIILLNGLLQQFGKESSFVQKYSQKDHNKLSWKALLQSPQFQETKKKFALQQYEAEKKLKEIYSECQSLLPQIKKANQYFESCFKPEFKEHEADDNFHNCYRQSTSLLYSAVRNELRTRKEKDLYFLLCLVCICHVFDDLVEEQGLKEKVFKEFLSGERSNEFWWGKLLSYLRNSSKEILLHQAQQLIQKCMT